MNRSRAIFVLLALAFSAALTVNVPDPVFTEQPKIEAAWFVQKPSGNVIGEVVVATLRITHPRGVYFSFLDLPDVGYSLDGLAEVRKRTISQSDFFTSIQSGQVVTEVRYELQYLAPIDFDKPETAVVGPGRQITYKYQLQDDGKIAWKYEAVYALGFSYSLVRRVDGNSVPYDVLGQWPVPMQWGQLIQILGGVVLLLAAYVFLRRRIRSGRKVKVAVPFDSLPQTTIRELYQMWRKTGDYRYFEQAIALYREPFFTKVQAGKILPPADWAETSAILYSGRTLDASTVEETFQKMLKREEGNV